jgi:hypothetical protein
VTKKKKTDLATGKGRKVGGGGSAERREAERGSVKPRTADALSTRHGTKASAVG